MKYYTTDELDIPERIKQMSISELEKAEVNLLNRLSNKKSDDSSGKDKLKRANKLGIEFNL